MSQSAFPSLQVTARGIEACGPFAQAQKAVLDPDPETVGQLQQLLRQSGMGIVAHYYMGPEIQGVLLRCDWPHIHISDSLVMADRAVQMARAGARAILVLGVDFMSENVRAMLDASGFEHVPVWRAATNDIGCSLAQAAEAPAYFRYLDQAASIPRSVHVVYVNTSLATKAAAEVRLPTITCTSSNVVATILQCFAEIPDGHVWFGPDTYMGGNVSRLLQSLADRGHEAVRAVHPGFDADSLRDALLRLHYFQQGNCIVHHLFGDEVVEKVRRNHSDALIAAHLEVPGAMFGLALEAQLRGRGVVGSTSDILKFVERRVSAAIDDNATPRLPVILGTEAGLVTSMVHQIREQLARVPDSSLCVEVIFPVASEAVFVTSDRLLPVVPGVASGEGCSLEGGCATCPYMKMNHLDAVLNVLSQCAKGQQRELAGFAARRYESDVNHQGFDIKVATRPLLAMRHFGGTGHLPEVLVHRALGGTIA